MWVLPNFLKERPRANFTNLRVSTSVSRDACARPKKGVDRIGTNAEASFHLLRSCIASAKVVEASSEAGPLVMLPNESAIQFADAVCLKAIGCGNAYSGGRIKNVFTEGLPLTFHSSAGMFWGRALKAHLMELAQYANTILGQQHGQI